MSEYVPDVEQVVDDWLKGGRSLDDMQALVDVVESGRENGYLRDTIPCAEFRTRFLDMAESLYVRNEPVASRPLKDYELGAHQASCTEEGCQLLDRLYWLVLRPSRPEQAETTALMLRAARDKLAGSSDEA